PCSRPKRIRGALTPEGGAGGALPPRTGEVVVQGEDLGAWIAAQRAGWDKLVPAQQWLLESVGVDPDQGAPAHVVVRSQADRWETNLAAARQFQAREDRLQFPRKHVEAVRLGGDGDGVGGEDDRAVVKLGAWLDNTRRRATKLRPRTACRAE
ncbi:hypothetical protein ABZZ74_52235, partial [Streptomyces sp. NPDC006476]|uniref:hypothetical protein n=1 Tax=Streptomyces sp. NPDC006476 TaxID=3157175 RepID=UPI0033BCE6F0